MSVWCVCAEISREVAMLQEQHSQQLEGLQEDFSRCGAMLAQAYDRSLPHWVSLWLDQGAQSVLVLETLLLVTHA